jgi:ribosomal protein S18 acetylase RimI-like enzyme
VQIERLRALDAASENLLRERAEEKGRDGDAVLRQIDEALIAGKAEAACLYDDAQVPCGIVVWRWPSHRQKYAQVLVFYVQAASPPPLSEALVDYVFSELARVHSLEVIEVRARDEAPGGREVWQRHDFVLFERCRMVRPLGIAPLPVLSVPYGYRIVSWRDSFYDSIERIAAAAYEDTIESVVVPGDQGHRLIDQLRQTWTNEESEQPGADASRFALDGHGQVIGYAAVSALNGGAQIVDLAVLPEHRRRGLARVLLVRSMAACQRHGLDTVSVAVTTRNPARQLYNQLGFRAVDCGEVAIWWQDGRQLNWQE